MLLSHVCWIKWRAKANVPSQRSQLKKSYQGVVYCVDINRISYNGPAIWRAERKVPTCYVGIARSQNAAVAVTRRSIRAGSWYFSRQAVTVQGGYGALFAVF